MVADNLIMITNNIMSTFILTAAITLQAIIVFDTYAATIRVAYASVFEAAAGLALIFCVADTFERFKSHQAKLGSYTESLVATAGCTATIFIYTTMLIIAQKKCSIHFNELN